MLSQDRTTLLPLELFLKISHYLTYTDIRSCLLVNTHWHNALSFPEITAPLARRRRVNRNLDDARVVKLSTIAAHANPVQALKLRGNTFATAAAATVATEQNSGIEVRVWSLKTLKRVATFVVWMPMVIGLDFSEAADVLVVTVKGRLSPLRMVAYWLSDTSKDPEPLYKVEQQTTIRCLVVSARYVATIDHVQNIMVRNVKDGKPVMTLAYDAPLTDPVIGIHLLPTHLLFATSTGLLRTTPLPTPTTSATHQLQTIHRIPTPTPTLFDTFVADGDLCLTLGPRAMAYYHLTLPTTTPPLHAPTARMTGTDSFHRTSGRLAHDIACIDAETGRALVGETDPVDSVVWTRNVWIIAPPHARRDETNIPVMRELGWISPRMVERRGGRFEIDRADGTANLTTKPPLCVDRHLWADEAHKSVKRQLRATAAVGGVVRAAIGAECVVMGMSSGKVVVALFDEREG
ncbi:hypothetical protein BC938DRAFT_480705 [Jimgerdemannia flammicorona]|uniref:F-box domain-containing protein n=1 Tax=Jimgerdemannia flammicorona TaxID=994334 RepID=A0A433QIL8_9FUNG|nr:hypothetical protein BC938DRAFT_480705 [Jimgerdemannia flammicorona]